ncbi:alpha beta-hydrolase, partial [Cystoisospora suis]
MSSFVPGGSALKHPDFTKWIPVCVPRDLKESVILRVFCFHGAGMDVTVWSGVGTPRAPMANPLVDLCQKEDVQMLAVRLPGRSVRSHEPIPATIQECASQLLEVIEPLVSSSVPYVFVGYSMGCLVAFELCCLLAKRKEEGAKVHMPIRVIVASMSSPDTPKEIRPWPDTRYLNDKEFQEELRAWSCNEVLFQPDLWQAYSKLLRNDHNLLDAYVGTKLQTPLGGL